MHTLWAPRRAWWWMAVLFAIGSTCFLVGPIPAFLDLVGPQADGAVFFVGSIFFTVAAALQLRESVRAGRERPGAEVAPGWRSCWQPHNRDWWSSLVQLAGTLFFNATTLHGLTVAIDSPSYNHLVWRPDAFGSVCFLVSGWLAYVEAAETITAVNLFGCVAFGVSAVGAFVIPSSQSELDMQLANLTTALGGLAFLIGSLLLLWQKSGDDQAPVPAQ